MIIGDANMVVAALQLQRLALWMAVIDDAVDRTFGSPTRSGLRAISNDLLSRPSR